MVVGKLKVLEEIHVLEAGKIELSKCKEERLDAVLEAAELGKSPEERIKVYAGALQLTSHGYSVILERDIEEINTNNYNAEWIKAWDGNIDIVICMDYFGVITYITDYYMKDESGTLKFIENALENSIDDSIKSKLRLVKNTFLTHRQVGEAEAYYKLFPFLHLSDSNIGTVFILTGFPKNISRFLRQISQEEKDHFSDVIEVEGKDGKFYIEKESLMEKYENCPKEMKHLFNFQFIKRYETTKTGPENYNILDDMNTPLSVNDIKIQNYIIHKKKAQVGDRGIKLPRFIPLVGKSKLSEHPWVKLRSPRVVRFHKFKQKTNPHEFYYSEMQKYLPFKKEKELFPNNFKKCEKKYKLNKKQIDFARQLIMPYLKSVEEGRERAEEIIANDNGKTLDPTKEQEDDDDASEGFTDHPDHIFKDYHLTMILDQEQTIYTGK